MEEKKEEIDTNRVVRVKPRHGRTYDEIKQQWVEEHVDDPLLTPEEVARVKEAEREVAKAKGPKRAGYTKNHGHGVTKAKRKAVKMSRRMNRK